MLLLKEPLYDENYAVSTLLKQLQEQGDQQGEDVMGYRCDAWSRLLAVFRIVYGGVEHVDLRLPTYGGRLFDPDRFPFLEGRPAGSSWRETAAQPLKIDNRTVLHLLNALQYLQIKVAGSVVCSDLAIRKSLTQTLEKQELNTQRERDGLLTNPQITPDGKLSQDCYSEEIIPADIEERLAMARRLISERCLYGVDINPMAVEMATRPDFDISVVQEKERLLKEVEQALEITRLGADLLIAIALSDSKRQAHIQDTLGMEYVVLAKAYDEALNQFLNSGQESCSYVMKQ